MKRERREKMACGFVIFHADARLQTTFSVVHFKLPPIPIWMVTLFL
jgi:hypothetical protein